MTYVLKAGRDNANDGQPARFNTLGEWLKWQQKLHFTGIDLGLQRCNSVAARLNLLSPAYFVISIAGTNGKGSSARMLEMILNRSGYKTGCYTSPHLLRYSERIRVNEAEVDDGVICDAFDRVDKARGGTSLTYFEFGTLAALDIFDKAGIDIAILEVGLGGRLDAVNMIDADVVLLTSIDIDHKKWLGDNRESIGYEKAGILRASSPVVCSDPHPPDSVRARARTLGSDLYIAQQDFTYHRDETHWCWCSPERSYEALPTPVAHCDNQLENAAGVVQVLQLIADKFPVTEDAIVSGLENFRLDGRCQVIPGDVPLILDVAHNQESIQGLVTYLQLPSRTTHTHVIIGMLADKDHAAILGHLSRIADFWYVAGLHDPRGIATDELLDQLHRLGIKDNVTDYQNVGHALTMAKSKARAGDRLVVTGSFITVAEAMKCLGYEG